MDEQRVEVVQVAALLEEARRDRSALRVAREEPIPEGVEQGATPPAVSGLSISAPERGPAPRSRLQLGFPTSIDTLGLAP